MMMKKTVTQPATSEYDWDAAYQRIAALKMELIMENEPSIEALERVWAEHARQLAIPLAREYTGKSIDLVFVRLCDEVYALEVDYVYDIRPAEQITLVPHAPDWVLGVYNLRGHILSVVDLYRFLGFPQPADRKIDPAISSLIVVKTAEMECAFLVDQVLTVEILPVEKIRIASELVRGLRSEYVHGIVESNGVEGNFTAVLLNIRIIITDERLVVNQEFV